MSITPLNHHPTLLFAAQELQKYLRLMTGLAAAADGIRLELLALPASSHEFDDEITVNVVAGQGVIAGANPRSVLLGVYRFLAECGCRWVRPGPGGEIIPQRAIESLRVQIHERAAYRHRGIVIEGAVSLQNVLEMIDWAPKVGFSAYYIQFREGFTFFDRWYRHKLNPTLPPEEFTIEQARAFTRQIEAEIARRGMIYHAVGHGWTCEAFGIPGLGWDQDPRDYPPEVIASLAEVNGKRAMLWDIPMITSLCFSQPGVRAKVVAEVTNYALAHPEVDLLHFWLDDGFNNKCECSGCRQKLPADFYIDLLNEVDALLTAQNSAQKIVFLAYVDMLWPPETSRLNNPGRFTFMFAPTGRNYLEPFIVRQPDLAPPPFERNRLPLPKNVDENLAFLRPWQQFFDGDSFVFEYYFTLGWYFTYDPAHLHIARLIHTDIRALRANGLNGMLSCQVQRVFLPTGLGMTVMGRTLWDDTLDFDALADDYFRSAFGADGALAFRYIEALAAPFDWLALRRMDAAPNPAEAGIETRLSALAAEFAPVIERNRALPQPAQALSWEYLGWHTQIVLGFARIASAKAQGDLEKVVEAWQALRKFLQEHEPTLQPVLDVWALIDRFDKVYKKP